MSNFNALIGIDFSLIGTKLHAAYEKKGEEGYAVLLIPTVQEADSGISILKVIEDIKKLVNNSGSEADTGDMEKDLTDTLAGLQADSSGFDLSKIIVKLNMAYLYLRKGADPKNDVLEYAFQLQVITEGLIPKEIAQIVDVSNLSLSVWNTSRKKVVEQMQLIRVDEYLDAPAGIEEQKEEG